MVKELNVLSPDIDYYDTIEKLVNSFKILSSLDKSFQDLLYSRNVLKQIRHASAKAFHNSVLICVELDNA